MGGPKGYVIAIAIKNALVKMKAAPLRRSGLMMGISGF